MFEAAKRSARDFWSNYDCSGGLFACWLWTGPTDKDGYGRYFGNEAHRHAYELVNGPTTLYVLHRCDTPACGNPSHLRAGTQSENMQDATERGRVARGERNGRAKLTADNVAAIRAAAALGARHRALARAYGVDHTTIRDIVKGRIWRALPA